MVSRFVVSLFFADLFNCVKEVKLARREIAMEEEDSFVDQFEIDVPLSRGMESN